MDATEPIKFVNPFILGVNEYKRDINVLEQYLRDASHFLSMRTGKSIEECTAWLKSKLGKGGSLEFKDPKIVYLEREENGDRVKKEMGLSGYLKQAVNRKALIAPTLTTYIPESEKESFLAKYIQGNIKKRNIAKKAMFVAQEAKQTALYAIKKQEQTYQKLKNNAVSGAHVSASTPLYNKLAHATLTSNCRSTSGYGNANNEKLLCGNRHYWSHDIVLNNIVSICTRVDVNATTTVMQKYNLHYPTIQDVLECITASSSQYWNSGVHFSKIAALVKTLTPIQRAAFVYTGDMFHIKKHNDSFTREFIKRISSKVTGIHPDPMSALKMAPDAYLNHAHQICAAETKGIGKEYSKIADTPAIHTLALTVENIMREIMVYQDFIKTFFVTSNVPASVARLPDSYRHCALVSDTDSTIFTVQDWVLWYKGEISFDEEACSVASAMSLLASSTIVHVLAMMSANFGVDKSKLFLIEMKNEYTFPVFVKTNLGKHYFAVMSCQEGNVYTKLKDEIKGVHLKSSNSPVAITKLAKQMMLDIMNDVINDKTVSIHKYLDRVAKYETDILLSLIAGKTTYLRGSSIKDAESYTKGDEENTYKQHIFWNKTFGNKYGMMEEPPYDTVKFSVNLETTKKLTAWLDGMEDRELADSIRQYLISEDKRSITTLHIPQKIISMVGIPTEAHQVVNAKKITSDICNVFYLILETLAMYNAGDGMVRLISDYYPPKTTLEIVN